MTVTRIYLGPKLRLHGSRSPGFDATLHAPDGERIVTNCSSGVIYEAARVLQSSGIVGRLEMYTADGTLSMTGDIDNLARFTVEESSHRGLRVRSHRKRPPKVGETGGRTRQTHQAGITAPIDLMQSP